LTSILMIFTSQTWNMTFSVYHSIRAIPQEKQDCAIIYSFSRVQRLKWLELPCSTISLIWNSIMSMAGGWFFLMASEAFTLKSHNYKVPGLGSYMSVAAGQSNITAMIFAVVAMIVLIIFLHQFLWSPLISWAGKFRLESNTSEPSHFSWFYELLKKSSFSKVKSLFPSFSFTKHKIFSPLRKNLFYLFSRPFLLCLLTCITLTIALIIYKIHQTPLELWLHLGYMTFLTLGRVLLCLTLSLIIALPLAMAIGLSKKVYSLLEPILQITASFPATLLFPTIVWLLHLFHIPLNIGSILLMLTGSIWYIVFTTLAGVSAIPNDYQEVSKIFRLRSFQKILSLYLPSIFHYLITGMISSMGGAWNASIVAEYISYKGNIYTVPGIGSTINLA
ncbi:MAG: ABC transporter permease subunit, partial [Verrucomicrobia bacterium]|nr:ABC transporter permease subunit [Verrucomicrobiota bacterium]